MNRLGILVGGTRYGDPVTRATLHSFDMLDLDAKEDEPFRIKVDFLVHGFCRHPKRPEAALLEKRGPGGCYVNLAEKRVVKPIVPMDGHHFYGHGAFSREGDVLFAVETDLASKDGVISVRDPESFAVIDTFPTFGKAPHDCTLIEDGKTLVITNGGGPFDSSDMPCVTFVDTQSRKLLEKHEVSDTGINTGHVALSRERSFVVVSAPRDGLPEMALGGVSIRPRGGKLTYATEPRAATTRMVGESLSVAIHERTRTALCTHPYGGLITFWNLDTGKLFAALDVPNARGVTLTLDGRYWVVAYGDTAGLLFIETSPLKPLTDRPPGTRRFGGSHLYAWSSP